LAQQQAGKNPAVVGTPDSPFRGKDSRQTDADRLEDGNADARRPDLAGALV
jgi:hypothetical protein